MRLEIRNEYPPEWPLVSLAVKEAAGWRCIRCGHPDPPDCRPRGLCSCDAGCMHRPDGKQRVLTVHHLDGIKVNLAWWNLLALCQRDHLIIQARVIVRRAYLFEHSAWFKPYVAGFYAAQAGVSLGRDEIEAELERFLALGQPWLY